MKYICLVIELRDDLITFQGLVFDFYKKRVYIVTWGATLESTPSTFFWGTKLGKEPTTEEKIAAARSLTESLSEEERETWRRILSNDVDHRELAAHYDPEELIILAAGVGVNFVMLTSMTQNIQ